MQKKSSLLRALGILGPEEILKLSHVLSVKKLPLKKVAGEDLVIWEGVSEKQKESPPQTAAKIIDFPVKKNSSEPSSASKETEPASLNGSDFRESDVLIWQQEISRSKTPSPAQMLEALKDYRRSTEMYLVQGSSNPNLDRLRFAPTNGVLINKKQA